MNRLGFSGLLAVVAVLAGLTGAPDAAADSAEEIDIRVDVSLDRFRKEVEGADAFLRNAKGVLVFPSVKKAGLGIGGEYGEGALRIGGQTAEYYSTSGLSIGLQVGAQSKTVIMIFLADSALGAFRSSSGWKAGVDGSVALVEIGTGGAIDTNNVKDPIVGFIFNNKGLMANLTLEGSKFTKLVR